jgi:hypothetical protein
MESFSPSFPRHGKKFSTPWKTTAPKNAPQTPISPQPKKHPNNAKNTVFQPFWAHFCPQNTLFCPVFDPKLFHAMESFFGIFPRYGK